MLNVAYLTVAIMLSIAWWAFIVNERKLTKGYRERLVLGITGTLMALLWPLTAVACLVAYGTILYDRRRGTW